MTRTEGTKGNHNAAHSEPTRALTPAGILLEADLSAVKGDDRSRRRIQRKSPALGSSENRHLQVSVGRGCGRRVASLCAQRLILTIHFFRC